MCQAKISGREQTTMRLPAILLGMVMLAACGGQQKGATDQAPRVADAPTASSEPTTPQFPPVEFGKRRPNTRMTSDNMPFFDRVTYCVAATKKTDRTYKGPAYESCVEDQEHYHLVLGEAIDAAKFNEADIVRCAKASRTAYQGLWLCLNGQDYR